MPTPQEMLNQVATGYEQKQQEQQPAQDAPKQSQTCSMCNAMVAGQDPDKIKAFMANNPFNSGGK